MLSRPRLSGLACGIVLCLAAPSGPARTPEELTPEMRQALRAVKTVRVEVEQSYDLTDESVANKAEEEKDEGEKDKEATAAETKSGDPKPEADKPVEKYTLPLEELAGEVIKLTGWSKAAAGEAADATLFVVARGTPLGAQYIGTLSGYFYTGAELNGSVRLALGGRDVAESYISAEIPVAQSISSYSWSYHAGPRDAPFRRTLPKYCEAVFAVIGRASGPGPVVAGLKLADSDLHTGAGRALLEVGDASVEPALIELLGQDNDRLARIAALGLGVHGRAAALPPLLAVLRKDKSDAALAGNKDPSDAELVSSLFNDPDELLPPRERAAAARGMLDGFDVMHRAVEWALLQIEAPDKFSQLTAALQGPDSVMLRRGAAVVLGGMGDQRAFALLAAAARDKEPLVRAAALAALGRLKDERSVEIFLAASGDAFGYVARLAREQLVEPGSTRWEEFIKLRAAGGASWNKISVPVVREGFSHSDPLVRAAAARASGYRSEPEIIAGLAALLRSDPQAFVREAAVAALAEQRDDSNAGAIAPALGDADAATRRRAVEALTGYFEGEDDPEKKVTRSRLPETALAPVFALLERDELGIEAAASLLGRIEGPGVADKLLQVLQGAGPAAQLRLSADRLAELGDKRAVTPLLALLGKTTDEYASKYVADDLVTLKDPAALEPLFALLKSGSSTARRLAMNVLSRFREPRAIGPLIAAVRAGESARFGDPAEGQAGLAREALETLTGKSFATGDDWLRWWKENSGKPFVLPPPKAPAPETPVENEDKDMDKDEDEDKDKDEDEDGKPKSD